ncbi:MAG: hypothetical protein JXP73_20990 [Deltaproteobacteria bacterium]|nr:hypothetical protein [Deltaproteobacteria bacterium]
MSVKCFLPQGVVDSWITADKVELSGEVMVFRGSSLSLRLVPGFYFDHVAGGRDEDHRLLGRVKSKAAVAALGAEVYMNSLILGETAYEVEAGFVAKPLDSACTRQALIAVLLAAGY